jgi:uncharacterized membrane protein HdeD (DUF308 family)
LASTASGISDERRANLLRLAGIAIIAIGIASVFLPAINHMPASLVIGAAMILAGAIELFAGSLRGEVRPYAMAVGSITALAGLLFILNPTTHLFPQVSLVIAWLVLRSLILFYASRHTGDGVRTWMFLSAGMDFLLALLLIAGLSIATIVISLFGPTDTMIASFAWVLAASFVVNGNLLLEVASCEREAPA